MAPFPIICFPSSSDGKQSAFNAGDPGSTPGSGRSPGEGNGNPIQYSCLKNPMDRGAWGATVQRDTELDTTEQLSTIWETAKTSLKKVAVLPVIEACCKAVVIKTVCCWFNDRLPIKLRETIEYLIFDL